MVGRRGTSSRQMSTRATPRRPGRLTGHDDCGSGPSARATPPSSSTVGR
jgi:hypothetical protein